MLERVLRVHGSLRRRTHLERSVLERDLQPITHLDHALFRNGHVLAERKAAAESLALGLAMKLAEFAKDIRLFSFAGFLVRRNDDASLGGGHPFERLT